MTSWKKRAAEMITKYERAVSKLEELGPEWERGIRELNKMQREYEDLKRELRVFDAADEQAYRKKISEGTRRGLERARRRGVKLGGARPRKSKVSLGELRRLRKVGLSQQQIADRLGCSQPLVSRRLKELVAANSKKSKTRRQA